MLGAEQLTQALLQGVGIPIVNFLSRGFGYSPVEGEYTYWLGWPTQVLGAGAASGAIPVTISQDAGFLWESIVGCSTGIYTVLIREAGKEITFMNVPIENTMLVGTAQRPGYPSLKPYYFRPNTTISVDFTDLSGSANTIRFAFSGRRMKADPGAFRYTRGALSRFV